MIHVDYSCQCVSTCGSGVGWYNWDTLAKGIVRVIEKQESAKKLQSHTEHVLDVTLSHDEKTFYIYDLSLYFRFSDERDQMRYRQRFSHSIAGKMHTVNFICDERKFTNDHARKIAIRHVEKSMPVYRLD